MTVSERLKDARERAGFTSVKAAAEAFGWPYSTYAGHENGSRAVGIEDIKRYAKALRVTPAWIAFGDANARSDMAEDYVVIPRYDAQLSAGHGSFMDAEPKILDHIPFTRNFLLQKLSRHSENGLIICEARGESMEPTIGDGDLIMIDTTHEGTEAGLYGIDYNGQTMVKRMERIDAGFSLISDNRVYPLVAVRDQDLSKLRILGKVIWIGRVV